jgi:exonuclease VII small subunit
MPNEKTMTLEEALAAYRAAYSALNDAYDAFDKARVTYNEAADACNAAYAALEAARQENHAEKGSK